MIHREELRPESVANKVRQDFLHYYNVQKGRKRDEYRPYHFSRVNK